MIKKEGFIYIWYDRKHKRYYIGCHWGTLDDGYICSSSWMKKAYRYRPQDFKRRILQRNIERKSLLEQEHNWLKLIADNELGKKYYNLSRKHFGHWSNIEDDYKKLTIKEKISQNTKKAMNRPDVRKKLEVVWDNNKGRVHSQEEKAKRVKSNTGKKRTEETKRKISESNKGKILGPLSDETKKKLSVSLSGEKNPFYGKQHDPELKKRMSEKTSATLKGRRPKNLDMFVGTKWWNNNIVSKRSKDCPGPDWKLGRL